MKILIPYPHDGNTYMRLLADAVQSLGHTPIRLPLNQGLQQNPDILWIHWPEHLSLGTPPTQTALIAFNELLTNFTKTGILAWTVHNLTPHAYPNHPAFRCLYQIVSAHAKIQIHHGHTSVAQTHALYPRPKDCITQVAHHGGYWNLLGNHTQESARQKLHLPPNKKILLAFGSLRSPAELDMVLTAATTGWHVLLAGRLPLIPHHLRPHFWLKRKRAAANFTRLDGRIPDPEVDPILKAADAVLIARNHTLNSGNVYLAMTFAKPLIGPNEGNTGEILALNHNFLFDPASPDSLPKALARALTSDLAPIGLANADWLQKNAQWSFIAQALLDAAATLRKT